MAPEAPSTFEGTESRSPHSSIWRPSGWNTAHRPLFARTVMVCWAEWNPAQYPRTLLPHAAWISSHTCPFTPDLRWLQYQWSRDGKVVIQEKGQKEPAALLGGGAWWGSLMQLWESGRTPKVLSKQPSHNHKSYQYVLGTLRAWEPEVVLSVKIQPAKSLAPQTRRWFSHLENEDCGGAGEKSQPQGSRNIYSASSDPWKECIISEILLW